MPITSKCPHCATDFEWDADQVGSRVACHSCQGVITLPETAPLQVTRPATDVQLIEQTGKMYKAFQAGGGLLIVVGLGFAMWMFVNAAAELSFGLQLAGAAITLIPGVGLYIYGRLLAWWKHG